MLMSKIDRSLLRETVFGVIYFSFFYRLSYIVNFFLGREFHNVVTEIDLHYPTISVFIVPYFFYFINIFISPYFIGYKNRTLLNRYTIELIISTTIGFLIYLLYPTWVDRSVFSNESYILDLMYKSNYKGG